MAKRLECIVEGCHATIEAESEEEVMSQATEHAQEKHPDLELDDEMAANIRSKIMTV